MHHPQINIKRLVIVVSLAVVAITVASLTVGRDIYNEVYYGSKAGSDPLISFAIISLAGYLFFLFIPVEAAFIYYLPGGDFLMLNAIALSTALISQSVDYIIGYSFSTKIIDQLIGRSRYEKAEAKIGRYGNITIFVFNFLPLSSPVISLAAGMLKHHVKDALLYTVLGLGLKYILLTIIFYK